MKIESFSNITIPIREAARLEGKTVRALQKGCKKRKLKFTIENSRGGQQYRVFISSLSLKAQYRYIEEKLPTSNQDETVNTSTAETDLAAIDNLQGFAKKRALEWRSIINDTAGLTREQLGRFVLDYKESHPEATIAISVSTIYQKRKDYDRDGILGLAPGWGATKRQSKIDPLAFERFEALYLSESKPTLSACRLATFGFMQKANPNLDIKEFPSAATFLYHLRQKHPPHYIDFKRKGRSYYQRNYEYYIARDWSDIPAGKGWVSDCHRVDLLSTNSEGKPVRLWLVVWMDIRTMKILSILVTEDDPSADHIMLSFSWAVEKFGLPDFIYLDNGKNYKTTDATGRIKKFRPWNEQAESWSRSTFGILNVRICWAREYNAQAKIIEPRFKVFINYLCKLLPGYTGSTVTSKPESLKDQIKKGTILSVAKCKELIEKFVFEIYNKKASHGEILNGKCPDDAYQALCVEAEKREVTAAGLKICRMRSGRCTIGRGGIETTICNVKFRFWDDFMYAARGQKVYFTYDTRDLSEVWVYKDEGDPTESTFLGKAYSIAKMSGQTIDKEALKEANRRKRRDLQLAASATKTKHTFSADEIVEDIAAGVQAESGFVAQDVKQRSHKQLTPFDFVQSKQAENEKAGTSDTGLFAPPIAPGKKKKLSVFRSDIDDVDSFSIGQL